MKKSGMTAHMPRTRELGNRRMASLVGRGEAREHSRVTTQDM